MPNSFAHEQFPVYQSALEFLVHAGDAGASTPRGFRFLRDQLLRAATSIPLNIAEGAGEFSAAEKARFYRMALRSASECAAVLDALVRLKAASTQHRDSGKVLLNRIAAMLTGLVHSVESRRPA